jgi:hypothetical protein
MFTLEKGSRKFIPIEFEGTVITINSGIETTTVGRRILSTQPPAVQ